VNAPPREAAAAKVCEALSPWGQVPVEVVGEEKL
jgi:hypothetical protein